MVSISRAMGGQALQRGYKFFKKFGNVNFQYYSNLGELNYVYASLCSLVLCNKRLMPPEHVG